MLFRSIMASGRKGIEDRVSGYENGADLYLAKPVEIQELLAAVAAVGRRSSSWPSVQAVEGLEGFAVDPRSLLLIGPARSTTLTVNEVRMLSAFSSALSQQLEYWQLIEILGYSTEHFSKSSLEVKIVRLRKKLIEVGAELGCLRSIRLVGYQLCVPLKII